MTPDEQLALWVKGDSRHNADRDECCPDFSCCQPDLLAPLEERELFASLAADSVERDRMLMMFLGRLAGPNVYVSGARDESETE